MLYRLRQMVARSASRIVTAGFPTLRVRDFSCVVASNCLEPLSVCVAIWHLTIAEIVILVILFGGIKL